MNKLFAFLTVETKITNLKRLGKYEEGKRPRTVVVNVSIEWQKRLILMSPAELKIYDKTIFVSKELSLSEFLIENKLVMKRRTMIEIGVSAKNLRLRDFVLYQYDEESGNWKRVEESNWLPTAKYLKILCLNVRNILNINRRTALSNAILQTDYDILCLK